MQIKQKTDNGYLIKVTREELIYIVEQIPFIVISPVNMALNEVEK